MFSFHGDRFEQLRPVDISSFWTVFRARDRRDGSSVALKVLREPDRSSPALELELAQLCSLRHPNIVRHTEYGRTTSGELYLAMEWLEGETLEARLRATGGALDVASALELGQRVASALTFAEREGIAHRNLKPSNLLFP